MIKWIVPLGLIVFISFTGCDNKKKETSQQFRKEPPKLNNTPNELQKLESGKTGNDKPAEKMENNAGATVEKSELYKSELKDLSVGELWKVYKQCRTDADKAKEKGDYKTSIDLMLKGAEAAVKLERPGITSWQYNNAAKHAIDYFKAESKYDTRMSTLTKMKHGDDKIAYKKETKEIMKDKFNILKDAENYLNTATKYNEMENDPKRVSAIESNMRFIKETALFIE